MSRGKRSAKDDEEAFGVPKLQKGWRKKYKLGGEQRWARRQVDRIDHSKYQAPEGANDYNIWYGRFLGDAHKVRERASTRMNPKLDCGLTRGSFGKRTPFLCLHFAKGACIYGADCLYLHRLPSKVDEKRIDMVHDIFGRDRHSTDREDMGGVGTFTRNSRSLWIADFTVKHGANAEEIIARHFGVFGPLEEVAVKTNVGCGFVRYTHRIYAEFAKAAMMEQSLDHNEQINVRWAHDDPNPKATERESELLQQQLVQQLHQVAAVEAARAPPQNAPQPAPSRVPPHGPRRKRRAVEVEADALPPGLSGAPPGLQHAAPVHSLEAPAEGPAGLDQGFAATGLHVVAALDEDEALQNEAALDAVLSCIDSARAAQGDAVDPPEEPTAEESVADEGTAETTAEGKEEEVREGKHEGEKDVDLLALQPRTEDMLHTERLLAEAAAHRAAQTAARDAELRATLAAAKAAKTGKERAKEEEEERQRGLQAMLVKKKEELRAQEEAMRAAPSAPVVVVKKVPVARKRKREVPEVEKIVEEAMNRRRSPPRRFPRPRSPPSRRYLKKRRRSRSRSRSPKRKPGSPRRKRSRSRSRSPKRKPGSPRRKRLRSKSPKRKHRHRSRSRSRSHTRSRRRRQSRSRSR